MGLGSALLEWSDVVGGTSTTGDFCTGNILLKAMNFSRKLWSTVVEKI